MFWGVAYFAWDFLVEHQAFTSSTIIQGILTGPYYHFWYLYVLVGLYILTPIFRIVVAHADQKTIKYLVILWFLGLAVIPFVGLLTTYHLDSNILTITGYVGYFVLGVYLLTVRMRRSTLFIFMSLGLALTAVGTYLLAATVGGGEMYFFQQYLSPTMILASVMLFLLLNTIQAPSNQIETRHSKISWLLCRISQNTLAIYLFHVMILETLQKGYLGFTISGNTLNSIIGVPLITVVTIFICLGVIIPLKKIPVLKKIIG